MRYCNSLLLLRLITVLLAVLLARHADLFLQIVLFALSAVRYSLVADRRLSEDTATKIQWDEVDVREAVGLGSVVSESLRLNELLARPQYKCTKSVRVGGEHDAFRLCNDGEFFDGSGKISEALLISGSMRGHSSFIKSIDAQRWTAFIPQGYASFDHVGGVDVEVHYLMHLRDARDWGLEDILTELRDRTFDTAFLDFFSPFLSTHVDDDEPSQFLEAHKLVKSVLEVLKTKHLQLMIRIEPESAEAVTFEWYRLLYRIFFDFHFALIGAESSGWCGRTIQHCVYRVSFVHFDAQPVEAPVFGFGSPAEERARLMLYLLEGNSENSTACALRTRSDSDGPLFCLEWLRDARNCSFAYVRYRVVGASELANTFPHCRLFFFSPLNFSLSTDSVRFFNFGISPKVNESMEVPNGNGDWILKPFAELAAIAQNSSLWLFDLDGAEWDVLEMILASPDALANVCALSFRLRIWIGEENENIRGFYSRFLRLERLGFRKIAFRTASDSIHYVVLRRECAAS